MAEFDTLTGVHIKEDYDILCKEYQSSKKHPVGLIYCSIYFVKEIDDWFGHSECDRHIKIFSDLLRSAFDAENCYRIKTGKFVIILENIEESEFLKTSKRFLKKASSYASVGAGWREAPETLNEVMAAAAEDKLKRTVEEFQNYREELYKKIK